MNSDYDQLSVKLILHVQDWDRNRDFTALTLN